MIFPAISIQQPWAWAILHAGKDVENRTWALPKKYIDILVLIHAGKKRDWDGEIYLREDLGFETPAELPLGGIVGWAVFSDKRKSPNSGWAEAAMHHWHIATSGELRFYPCKGSLGFFQVDYPYGVQQ